VLATNYTSDLQSMPFYKLIFALCIAVIPNTRNTVSYPQPHVVHIAKMNHTQYPLLTTHTQYPELPHLHVCSWAKVDT